MENYRFKALDQNGSKVSGVESATSAGAAHLALLRRGFQPLVVKEQTSILKFELTKKLVPRKEIMHFSRQLGVFVEAGIPIMEALDVIAQETSDKLLKRALIDILGQIQGGETFASAAASHPEAFPKYYISVLASAELTGTLDVVLAQLAEYIERDADARSQVISALIYPAVVFVMAIITVVVLAAFVLPRFRTFFKSLHAKLPLPTRMLLSVSGFISHWWFAIIGGILLVVIVSIATRRSRRGRARLDSIILKLPVAGGLVQAAVVERVCRVLSSLIGAGVDLPQAMSVTADSANNAVYFKAIVHIREQMMEGKGLAQPLAQTDLFPAAAQQMFRVGEETGTLEKQLHTAASFYHRELEAKIKHFTGLFEPAIIIFMGVIVGFVAVALVSAMYGIYRQVNVS